MQKLKEVSKNDKKFIKRSEPGSADDLEGEEIKTQRIGKDLDKNYYLGEEEEEKLLLILSILKRLFKQIIGKNGDRTRSFEILGIPDSSNQDEIKRAYRIGSI